MNAKLNNSVSVAGVQTLVTEYNSVPVLTTAQLAEFYGTDSNNVQMNFSRNTARFEEGKHYFKLQGEELKAFKNSPTMSGLVDKRVPSLTLWTEKGAARHAKILDTDQAWNVFEQLEDSYFKVKGIMQNHDPMQILADPNLLRNALLTYSEKVIELENKVEEMTPALKAFDRIATAEGSLCLTDAAKTLQQEPHKFNKWLNLNNWIYKRTGSKHWVGYQDKVKSGYLEHKVKDIPMPDGSTKIAEQVRVTPKGLTQLSKLLGNK